MRASASDHERLSEGSASPRAFVASELDLDAPGLLRGATRVARRALLQGSVLGRFLVLEKLGEGGMGVVYAAYDPALNRRVALKLLLLEETPEDEVDASSRLVREARALAVLSHPNVVAVYEVGEHEGDVFIAMEYVEGQTLRDWLKAETRSWQEVLRVCIEAGRGLAAAHAAALVHRDFKPANVLVGNDGRVRVMDFGLARASSGETGDGPTVAANSGDHAPSGVDAPGSSQNAGVAMGTPAYIAPEQRHGIEADARSDQYSYCVSLFEALYGQKPTRERAAATPPPRGTNVPRWVHRVLERGLQDVPEKRFASMEELLQALQANPSLRRKKMLGVAAGVLLIPAAAAGAALWQHQQRLLCKNAEANLVGVWDQQRRTDVEAAMLGTGAVFAPNMWAYVQPRLDDYARAWAEQHMEACEATNLRGEQSTEMLDLRMGCLHRAKVKLHATVDLLASADTTTVQKAADVLEGLERLSRCSNAEGLRANVRPPAPEDARAVERARAILAQSSALRRAARYPEAETALQEAEAVFSSIDYGPLQTEIQLERGELSWRGRGDYEASEAALRAALRFGARWHQWDSVRDAATVLLHLLADRQLNPREARQYAELAKGLGEGQGDLLAQAQVHNNWSGIFYIEGKYEEAEMENRRALELRIRTLGADHPLVAHSTGNIAAALTRRGDHREAEVMFRKSLELLENAFGPEHPDVATSLANLGAVLWSQERHEESEAVLRRALVLREKVLGPNHPLVGHTVLNIGVSLLSQARYEEAEAELRRSLELGESTLGKEHPLNATCRRWLAEVLLAQQRAGEALAMAELSWAVRQEKSTPPERQADTAFVLARALWDSGGDKSRARSLAQRAVEMYGRAGEAHAARANEVELWRKERQP